MDINTITTTHERLKNNETTSVKLVKEALEKIHMYDDSLNSLADLNHEALMIADALDQERLTSGFRSKLHGIPIVIKDNILTHDAMRTTANSFVFKNFYGPYDATIVKHLRDAGAVILAKANCSEFAYFMAMGSMPSGFGSHHGQVKHPYDTSIDPLGSSTGSAVAVAADLVCASIGTETNGSLMSPAQQNSIVSIKPTLGLVSRHGIIPITYTQDTAGPMTKTVKDSAIMLDIIASRDDNDSATQTQPKDKPSYFNSCTHPIKGKNIGILHFTNYTFSDEDKAILKEAKTVLENQGATVIDISFTYALPNNIELMIPEFKRDINKFLASVYPKTDVKTLKDIIDFNDMHPKRALTYGQDIFLKSEATDGRLKDALYLKTKLGTMKHLESFGDLFDDNKLDAIMTTQISGYAPIGGLPSLIIPAKALKDTTPKSLLFIGKRYTESILFSLGHTYEQATKHRIEPDLSLHKTNNKGEK